MWGQHRKRRHRRGATGRPGSWTGAESRDGSPGNLGDPALARGQGRWKGTASMKIQTPIRHRACTAAGSPHGGHEPGRRPRSRPAKTISRRRCGAGSRSALIVPPKAGNRGVICTEPLMGNAGGNPEFHEHVHETAVDSRTGEGAVIPRPADQGRRRKAHVRALTAKLLERTCQVRNRVRQSRTLGSVGGGAQ